MTRVLLRIAVGMICVAVLNAPWLETANGTTLIRRSTEELTVLSDIVVEGVVQDMESRFDPGRQFIYTYVTLSIQQLLKGRFDGETIVLEELGGDANGYRARVDCSPEFTIGERVIVFLEVKNEDYYRAHGMCQGKFSVVVDPASGQEIVVRQEGVDETFNIDYEGKLDSTVDPATGKRHYAAFVQTIQANADRLSLPGGER